MRRREPVLDDPAVTAELEALEAALRGDPAAEPELATLVRDVRAQRPAMDPDFRARLDARAERRLTRTPSPARRARWRSLAPGLGLATALAVGLVAIVLAGGHDGAGESSSRSSSGGSAAPAREQSDSAAAPQASPAAPAQRRRVERGTRLQLTTTGVQGTADAVVRTTQREGGFVQSSQVQSGGRGSALFVLRVPAARLDDAVAALSRLGHVRSLQQSAYDITGSFDSAAARLADARAERRGLLRALGRAATAQEVSALRARLADNRRAVRRAQSAFDAVRRRANLATIEVDVTGRARRRAATPDGARWTPGDALHDAVRVLEVGAGVAVVGLAVLVPLGLLAAAGGLAAGAVRRRRREAALSA